MEKRRLIEIIAAVVFVALLVVACIWVVSASGNSSKIEVQNSYNTYNYYSQNPAWISTKPYIIDKGDYLKVYTISKDHEYSDSYDRYLDYNDWSSQKMVTGVFGQDIPNYKVEVRNNEDVGGYFKVTFYFEDKYGQTESKAMTYYIPAREEHGFVFKDVSNHYKYYDWHYKIESMTKAPMKVYYSR